MRVARVIGAVFLFLFLEGCGFLLGGGHVETNPITGAKRVTEDGAPVHVTPAHDHRCPVCGVTWSHRKKSCAAPVEYPCKEHKAAR